MSSIQPNIHSWSGLTTPSMPVSLSNPATGGSQVQAYSSEATRSFDAAMAILDRNPALFAALTECAALANKYSFSSIDYQNEFRLILNCSGVRSDETGMQYLSMHFSMDLLAKAQWKKRKIDQLSSACDAGSPQKKQQLTAQNNSNTAHFQNSNVPPYFSSNAPNNVRIPGSMPSLQPQAGFQNPHTPRVNIDFRHVHKISWNLFATSKGKTLPAWVTPQLKEEFMHIQAARFAECISTIKTGLEQLEERSSDLELAGRVALDVASRYVSSLKAEAQEFLYCQEMRDLTIHQIYQVNKKFIGILRVNAPLYIQQSFIDLSNNHEGAKEAAIESLQRTAKLVDKPIESIIRYFEFFAPKYIFLYKKFVINTI